jgi:hypothetical protein
MRWAGYVARMGRVEVRIGFWWGKRRKSNHLEELGKIIIKRILTMKANKMHYFCGHASRHQQNYHDKYLLRVYSVEILLMMDSGLVRSM